MRLKKINKQYGIFLEGVRVDSDGKYIFDYSKDLNDDFIKLNPSTLKSISVNGITVYIGHEPSEDTFKKTDELTFANSKINELEEHLDGKKKVLKDKLQKLKETKSYPDQSLYFKIKTYLKLLNKPYDSDEGKLIIRNLSGKNVDFNYEKLKENEELMNSLETEIEILKSEIEELKEKIEPFRKEYSEHSKDHRKLFSSLITSFSNNLKKGGKEYDDFIQNSVNEFITKYNPDYDAIAIIDDSKYLTSAISGFMSKSLGIPIIKPFTKIPAESIAINKEEILKNLGEKELENLEKFLEKHHGKTINISRAASKLRPYIRYLEINDSASEVLGQKILIVDDIIYSGSTMALLINKLEELASEIEGYALFKL